LKTWDRGRPKGLRDVAGCLTVQGCLDQRFLKLSAEHVLDAMVAKQRFVEGRVQTVRDYPRARVRGVNTIHDWDRESRRRVHREEKRDNFRRFDPLGRQFLASEIHARDIRTRLAQPRRRRCQAERLTAHVVGGNQENPHTSLYA
jgi:hypothetical protein